jgi:hypothetical protein
MSEELYADGGFPFIKLCNKDELVEEKDKVKREFNPKNIMSIQSILDKRRSTPFLTLPSRSHSVKTNDSDDSISDQMTFNKKYDLQKTMHAISNLDISNIMKPKRASSKKRKTRSKSK